MSFQIFSISISNIYVYMHKQCEYTVLRLIKWNHIKHSVLKFAFSFKIFHVYMRFHFILLCPRKNNYDLGLYNCQTESKLIWFNGLLWKLLRFLWLNSLQTLNPCCVTHWGYMDETFTQMDFAGTSEQVTKKSYRTSQCRAQWGSRAGRALALWACESGRWELWVDTPQVEGKRLIWHSSRT